MKEVVIVDGDIYGDIIVRNRRNSNTTIIACGSGNSIDAVEIYPFAVRKLRKVLEQREAELVKMGELEATE